MPALYLIVTLLALLPAIAFAGECRIEYKSDTWLNYLEDCPEDVTKLVLRHSVCVYALETFKDTRTLERIKGETQEVMEDRRCSELPCDTKHLLEKYKNDPKMVALVNQAYTQMNDFFHAQANGSTFDAPCTE